ncbi:MAG: type II toxin-antitoxin system VapC family toxin [ANME-2 cluster archaeon]|nr:type II toxin-antitoxin system VapC family toxin [ANME-2 cluster archaeon]MDF1530748.1 type II toxin-antitoxin system VapC family toxin [ANME-2 cluster archaeon]
MKYSLDTNVIISHFKGDRFSDQTDRFFAWMKDQGNKMFIADIVYAELYTGVCLSGNPSLEEKRIQRFLAVNEIDVKYSSSSTMKRSGELYAEYLLRNSRRTIKRILPDFMVGAHSEQHSNVLITWNPSDYHLKIEVMTPEEAMEA